MNQSLIYYLLAGGMKSIRVDNFIFFLRMGKVSYRRINGATSGKNWERTEKRVKSNGDFSGARYMSSHMKEAYDGLPVWKHAAEYRTGNSQTSDSYRHRVNHGCVNKLGEVEDFKHFVISDGSLLLPPDMTMTRQDNVITLAWNDERNATSARPSDIIHVMVIGTTRPDALMLLHGTSATRAEGTASFTVQAKENETLHVYPFFGNTTNKAFSPNEYFLAPAEINEPAQAAVTDKFHTFTAGQEINMNDTLQEFFNDVYEITRQIPRGKVLTYGKIAVLAGRPQHARWVGRAMAQAPANDTLPCHRVVNSVGQTAPGWPQQRTLLESEGVTFRANDRVDMKKHLWEIFPHGRGSSE